MGEKWVAFEWKASGRLVTGEVVGRGRLDVGEAAGTCCWSSGSEFTLSNGSGLDRCLLVTCNKLLYWFESKGNSSETGWSRGFDDYNISITKMQDMKYSPTQLNGGTN